MHSPSSDASAAATRGPGPGYVLRRPSHATDSRCHCHLCARDNRPSATAPTALAHEFRSGPRVRASPEEEEGVAVLEGPRARRPFPSQRRSRRGSGEEGPERNGVNGGHVPPKNASRRVDFYLGPDHCSVPGDHTPGFPREWDPCYSPQLPPRWNWPAVEPCREHCACTRDVWPEWERTSLPPPPPPPRPPCCYSPERQPPGVGHVPHQPPPEFRAHPRHRALVHGGLGEPCWECLRDHYWRDAHRPDLIAVDPVCGYNGQHQPALSPALSYGRERQRLSRQTSPEHGNFNGPSPVPRTFFATEVPPAKLRGSYAEEPGSCRPKSANGPQRREPELDVRKETQKETEKETEKDSVSGAVDQQGNVREQIRRVVGDLQEVLGGLKQVHLEMKEVVQQIDVLTSSIDIEDDEPGRRTSQESVLQQHPVHHEVKALVHRPAATHSSQEQKQQQQQQQQPLGINGHHTPTTPTPIPTPKPSTCHPSVTRQGHTTSGDLPRVAALISGHKAAKDRSKMNGNCVAPRPPRDRVKDAQRRRIELSSPSGLLIANGAATTTTTTSVKGHKPPPYPNHNGRVETLHKDSDVSMGALRPAAHVGKGRQLSTAV